MKTNLSILLSIICAAFLIMSFDWGSVEAGTYPANLTTPPDETITDELWLGIYMGGVKVGYSQITQTGFSKNGKDFRRSSNESWIKISRLGGGDVEIKTVQDCALCSAHGHRNAS